MSLKSEIFEQPAVLSSLLENEQVNISAIAQEITARQVQYIFLTARGSSDHAGLYAKYLWGSSNGLPVALAAPSLFSIYGRPPRLDSSLVVAISQSGQSPDILSVVREGKRQGVPTLAITNDPGSPLGSTADYVIDIRAGAEEAVAATKTYTAQLMAIAMLSVALGETAGRRAELARVPDLVAESLELDDAIRVAAERYRYMEQCVVLGRGYNYATAYEWSLKLKELAYVVAEPYSSADFQHGPVAIVTQGFPVLAVVPDGALYDDLHHFLSQLVTEREVELLAISNRSELLSLAQTPLPVPTGLPEWLSPLVTISAAQLFCYHLTRTKGYDTEHPRGLRKVTLTE